MRLLRVLAVATSFAALLAQPSAARKDGRSRMRGSGALKGGVLGPTRPNFGTRQRRRRRMTRGLDWLITRTARRPVRERRPGLPDHDRRVLETSSVRQPRERWSTLREPRGASASRHGGFPLQTRHARIRTSASALSLHQIVRQREPDRRVSRHDAGAQSARGQRHGEEGRLRAARASSACSSGFPDSRVFAQGTASWLQNELPAAARAGQAQLALTLEAGVRYNVGSSIDRER